MVSERLDTSAADHQPSAQARFAAEASIKAALSSSRAEHSSGDLERHTRKSKKNKKRSKNRSSRNPTAGGNDAPSYSAFDSVESPKPLFGEPKKSEAPKKLNEHDSSKDLSEASKDQSVTTPDTPLPPQPPRQDEIALGVPSEGEISMRHDESDHASNEVKETKEADEADEAEDEPTPSVPSHTEQVNDLPREAVVYEPALDGSLTDFVYQSGRATESPAATVAEHSPDSQAPLIAASAAIETSTVPAQSEAIQVPELLAHAAPEAASLHDYDPAPPTPPGFTEFNNILMRPANEQQPLASADLSPLAYDQSQPVPGNEHVYYAQHNANIAPPAPVAPSLERGAGRYSSDIPPGLQRSASEVSRAAWTGLLAGWFIGRRGKRKAVEKAVRQERQRAIRSTSSPAFAPRTPEQFAVPALNHAESPRTYQKAAGGGEVAPIYTTSNVHETQRNQPAAVSSSERTADRRPSVGQAGTSNAEYKRVIAKNVEAPVSQMQSAELQPHPNNLKKPISEMGKSELLKIAKDVKIDGISLKEIFNARRIDQEGLRAVVETYLRGGDVKRQLSEEVVAKEQSFERDPFLRHQRQSKASSSRFSKLASDVTAGAMSFAQERGSQLATSSQKSAKKAKQLLANGAKQAQHDIIDNSNTIDWLSITAIVIVYSLILMLLLH